MRVIQTMMGKIKKTEGVKNLHNSVGAFSSGILSRCNIKFLFRQTITSDNVTVFTLSY